MMIMRKWWDDYDKKRAAVFSDIVRTEPSERFSVTVQEDGSKVLKENIYIKLHFSVITTCVLVLSS